MRTPALGEGIGVFAAATGVGAGEGGGRLAAAAEAFISARTSAAFGRATWPRRRSSTSSSKINTRFCGGVVTSALGMDGVGVGVSARGIP